MVQARRRVAAAPLRGIRASFVFFSRIPVGGFPYSDAEWRWAAAHLPLVGIVIGVLSALTFIVCRPLGVVLAAALALLMSICLTGALHEDGLADSADALGGGQSGQRIFEILKDSRLGTFGVVALIMSLSLRALAIAELDAPWAIACAACAARMPPVGLLSALPYVSAEGAKGKLFAGAGISQASVAAFWVLVFLGALMTWRGIPIAANLAALAATLMVAMLMGRYFRARCGGVTGDFLGAVEQVGQVTFLLALLGMERVGL